MMPETVGQRAMRWDEENYKPCTAVSYDQLHQQLRFRAVRQFHEYIPTTGPDWPDFEDRLEMWLNNAETEDGQRLFLQLASALVYYSRDDFLVLHRSALRGPISAWVVEQLGLMLDAADTANRLQTELHDHTWYCAVSDSMQIADFHHANALGGIDYRPDFRTLSKLGDTNRILDYMTNRPKHLHRVVLLEDFIGSGAQLGDAVPLIASMASSSVPMLLVPLLVCPDGNDLARRLEQRFSPHLTYRPVVVLDSSGFLLPAPTPDEPACYPTLRTLLTRLHSAVRGDDRAHPRPYSPFGFRDTGALIVMYSNTPANTLAAIQHESNTWAPLFPRSARVR